LTDLESATRVTPSMSRRRAMSRATERWSRVQPCRSMAGASMAPRRPEPALGLAEPPAPGPRSPLSDASVTSAGMARERSRSERSQSKRRSARSRTVVRRWRVIDSKSAYGLSWSACATIAALRWLAAARSALLCAIVLSVST
jgi:hypothetical protein